MSKVIIIIIIVLFVKKIKGFSKENSRAIRNIGAGNGS